jgi:hypothetical protein
MLESTVPRVVVVKTLTPQSSLNHTVLNHLDECWMMHLLMGERKEKKKKNYNYYKTATRRCMYSRLML